MTAFIVKSTTERYIVKDPYCLGRTCLMLGRRRLYKHRLLFNNDPVEVDCCTTMMDKGCPKNFESLFSMEERKNNLNKGFGSRLI